MKKTFKFNVPNKKLDRQVESIKHEIKKYLGRERRKTIPDGADFWDFDCTIGPSAEKTSVILVHEISGMINQYVTDGLESFYLEILAKPGHKRVKKNEK